MLSLKLGLGLGVFVASLVREDIVPFYTSMIMMMLLYGITPLFLLLVLLMVPCDCL